MMKLKIIILPPWNENAFPFVPFREVCFFVNLRCRCMTMHISRQLFDSTAIRHFLFRFWALMAYSYVVLERFALSE